LLQLPIITKHSELAKAIQGKRILHLNSLGKDATLTLDWLNNYAKVDVVSVFFELRCAYPTDKKYWEYLKRQYPRTKFVKVPNLIELSEISQQKFQSPLFINYVINNQEYDEFHFKKACEELRVQYKCDYICLGTSKYEGMGRAIFLKRVGLLHEERRTIYPIGLMNQKQVYSLLKQMKTKLNPSYKLTSESHDTATYFKMRNAFIAFPEFQRTVFEHFPLLLLDKYRYEVLFGKKSG